MSTLNLPSVTEYELNYVWREMSQMRLFPWLGRRTLHSLWIRKKESAPPKSIVMEKGNLKEIANYIDLQWAKGRSVQHLLQDDDGVLVVFQWWE